MPIQLTAHHGAPESNNNKPQESTGGDLVPSSNASSETETDTASETSSAASTATSSSTHAEGMELAREEADRLYEERMEDEYAKREGGA